MKHIRIHYNYIRLLLNRIVRAGSSWNTSIGIVTNVTRSRQIRLLDYIAFLKDIQRVINKYKDLLKRDIQDVIKAVNTIEKADKAAGSAIRGSKASLKNTRNAK